MNKAEHDMKRSGGAFADGLTLIRVLLTPLVMYLIIAKGWPAINITILITVLFAVAALTDLFDDLTGGTENSVYRKLGWFDDIADTVLMVGTLAAMAYVLYSSLGSTVIFDDLRLLFFFIPVFIIIAREVVVALIKGLEFSRTRMFEVGLGNVKTAMIMLGTCILLATPWLKTIVDPLVHEPSNDTTPQVFDLSNVDPGIFNSFLFTHGPVWTIGLVVLWVGAILSVITGIAFLRGKYAGTANEG